MAVICEQFPHLRPAVFKAYAEDRVTDTMIRQQLLDIAGGVYRGELGAKNRWISYKYTLEDLARRCADIRLFKDGWRLSYAAFLDTPLEEWPARAREVQAEAAPRILELEGRIATATEAKDKELAKSLAKERDGLVAMCESDPSRASEYPLDDARATLAVFEAQEKHATFLADQYRQARGAWALHLSSAHGLRTDGAGVEALRAATQAAYDALEDQLIQLGFIRNDKKRTRDTKLAKARMIRVCRENGLPLRRTDGHAKPDTTKCRDEAGKPLPAGHDDCAEHVCLDAEACEASEDELLEDYAEISTLKKVLTTDVENLLRGVTYPVHTHYGLAETGRTTSSKPPIQNLRTLVGIRECFRPRAGHVYFAADFPAIEMYCWAQACLTWLGQSKLAEALNAGLDPHLIMAAEIAGCSYEEALARYDAGDQEMNDLRKLSKVANFGFPGGMGAAKMLVSAKKQLAAAVIERLGLNLQRMKDLRQDWENAWPEARPWFARANRLCDTPTGTSVVESLFTKRIRGGARYCATCNTGFQALAADIGKEALWRVAVAQYVTPGHALYNSRTVAFVHDEIIGEALEELAPEAAVALADVMTEAANTYLPDVKIARSKVKPVLMRRWSKNAKQIFAADGRLIAWDM